MGELQLTMLPNSSRQCKVQRPQNQPGRQHLGFHWMHPALHLVLTMSNISFGKPPVSPIILLDFIFYLKKTFLVLPGMDLDYPLICFSGHVRGWGEWLPTRSNRVEIYKGSRKHQQGWEWFSSHCWANGTGQNPTWTMRVMFPVQWKLRLTSSGHSFISSTNKSSAHLVLDREVVANGHAMIPHLTEFTF